MRTSPVTNSHVGARVGDAANGGGHDEVAVAGECAGRAGNGEAWTRRREKPVEISWVFSLPNSYSAQHVEFFGRAREESDGAAHGAVAEDAGGGAARNLGAADFVGHELRPIDPAAEGIVGGNAIPEDERAAGAGRSDTAQRDALRGGVGDQAGRAAEEAETGHIAQAVVEIRPGTLLKGGAVQGGNVGRGFGGNFLDYGDGGSDRLRFRRVVFRWILGLCRQQERAEHQDPAGAPASSRHRGTHGALA